MTGLDTILSIALVFVAAIPIGVAGAWFTSRGPNALAGFFRPSAVADLGWPIGVQEEDAPVWNWDPKPATTASHEAADVAPEMIELESAGDVSFDAVRAAAPSRRHG